MKKIRVIAVLTTAVCGFYFTSVAQTDTTTTTATKKQKTTQSSMDKMHSNDKHQNDAISLSATPTAEKSSQGYKVQMWVLPEEGTTTKNFDTRYDSRSPKMGTDASKQSMDKSKTKTTGSGTDYNRTPSTGTSGTTGAGVSGNVGTSGTGVSGNVGTTGTGASTKVGTTGTGVSGSAGTTGTGVQGNVGTTGTGTSTKTGTTGTGVSGSAGTTGTGVTGSAGTTGTGVQGNVGTTGTNASSNVGTTGTGVSGNVGTTGTGVSGSAGTTGTGVSGSAGTTGAGVSGNVGTTGTNASSKVGTTGTGVTGSVGTTGTKTQTNQADRTETVRNENPAFNNQDFKDTISAGTTSKTDLTDDWQATTNPIGQDAGTEMEKSTVIVKVIDESTGKEVNAEDIELKVVTPSQKTFTADLRHTEDHHTGELALTEDGTYSIQTTINTDDNKKIVIPFTFENKTDQFSDDLNKKNDNLDNDME